MDVGYCCEITAAEQVKWNLCNFWVRETKIIFKWGVILASGHFSPVLLMKGLLSMYSGQSQFFVLKFGAFFGSFSNFSLTLYHRCRYLWDDQILCHWVPNLCSCLRHRLTLFQLSDLRKGIRLIFHLFEVKAKVTVAEHALSWASVVALEFTE